MASNGVEIKQRELNVWSLRQAGLTQERVAEELGISRSYVSRIETRLAERITGTLEEEARRELGIQLAQLSHVMDESMQAWERSKGTERVVTQKMRPLADVDEDDGRAPLAEKEVTTRVRQLIGDARYLTTAMQAMQDIRSLLKMEELLVRLSVDWRDEVPSGVDPVDMDDLVDEFARAMLGKMLDETIKE